MTIGFIPQYDFSKFYYFSPATTTLLAQLIAFQGASLEEINNTVGFFFGGTAYTSWDRITFSYRSEVEHAVIEKQKPKSNRRSVLNRKKKRSNNGNRVRWSEVRKRCQSFFMLPQSQRYSVFVTISFPCGLSDKDCRTALNNWLTRIRQIRPRFPYLWVAERQKNGTLRS